MADKIIQKIVDGKAEDIDLTLDDAQSTKAKKVYTGTDSKGKPVKHIEMDMQPKNKDEKA